MFFFLILEIKLLHPVYNMQSIKIRSLLLHIFLLCDHKVILIHENFCNSMDAISCKF